ncbi:purine and uridine phosphorylase [Trichoderma velutinum]
MSPNTRSHADYSIGWICALSEEQTAAIAMLDEEHESLSKPLNDTNAYTLGSISQHNIVIACLPKGHTGQNSAATVATQMVQTFSSIKVGLMVGIGGGIPPKVRLGDVVVSTPVGQFPGVVQWDLGKSTDGGNFERTGSLNNPPNSLSSALGKLESKHDLEGSKIPDFLEQFGQKYPLAAKKYVKSTSLKDVLFKSSYSHVHGNHVEGDGMDDNMDVDINDESEDEEIEECNLCDSSQIVRRKPLTRPMRIHYGLIASSNTTIENAEVRDRLKKDFEGKVLCVEMEAAGLMNTFPCMIIRGICDYADSHKNKIWQKHAATVAAAFAKELLGFVQSSAVEGERPIRDILNDVKEELIQISRDITDGFGDSRKGFRDLIEVQKAQKQNEAMIWLSSIDSASIHHDYIKKCEPGTGRSLLASEEFQHWLDTPKTTFFCQGIPGAGKTFQTAILIDHLINKFRDDDTVRLAFFYYKFDRQDAQKPEKTIANLIKQLGQNHEPSLERITGFYEVHKKRNSRPLIDELVELLKIIIPLFSRTYVIVDALDECDDNDESRTKFLDQLFVVQELGVNIFATSRKIDVIEQRFEGAISRQILPSRDDIFMFLDRRMSRLPNFVQNNISLQEEIKKSIESAMEGMFLLAQLYIDSLVGQRTASSVRTSLVKLKKSSKDSKNRSDVLDEAYHKAMERIHRQKGNLPKDAMIILAWIVNSKRPLAINDLQLLLAIDVEGLTINEDHFPTAEHILQACAPLVVIESGTQTVRLVHYTAQEYFERSSNPWMEKSQIIIANICLSYLSFSKIRSVFALSGVDYEDDEEILYKYVIEFWGHHTTEALAQGFEVQRVTDFLEYTTESDLWCDSLIQIDLAENSSFAESENDLLQTPEHVVALHVAACLGLSQVVAKLISKGYSPDVRDKRCRSPLWWAAYNGHADVVEFLLQLNVNTEVKDSIHYNTPLKLAVGHDALPTVRLLLQNGADVESGDRMNYSIWKRLQ